MLRWSFLILYVSLCFCMFLAENLTLSSFGIAWRSTVVAYVCYEAVGSSQCVAVVGLSWLPQGKSPYWPAHCLLSTKMSVGPSEGRLFMFPWIMENCHLLLLFFFFNHLSVCLLGDALSIFLAGSGSSVHQGGETRKLMLHLNLAYFSKQGLSRI